MATSMEQRSEAARLRVQSLRSRPRGALTTMYNFCSLPNCADERPLLLAWSRARTETSMARRFMEERAVTYRRVRHSLQDHARWNANDVVQLLSTNRVSDGWNPKTSLVQGLDGDLYGTTSAGGQYSRGTVFKITTTGTLATLHSFNYTDGAFPSALIQATDGNFYGTAFYGGADESGSIFEIAASGTFTLLYSFNGSDGEGPDPRLCFKRATATSMAQLSAVGSHEHGTVFSLTGPTPTGVQFVPVTPCRLVDTRQTAAIRFKAARRRTSPSRSLVDAAFPPAPRPIR